jgi:chromosome segregation ATPase
MTADSMTVSSEQASHHSTQNMNTQYSADAAPAGPRDGMGTDAEMQSSVFSAMEAPLGMMQMQSNLDTENSQLRAEVERLTLNSAASEDVLDDMLLELNRLKTELKSTKDQLVRKEADIRTLHARLNSFEHRASPSLDLSQGAGHLKTELHLKEELLKIKDKEIEMSEAKWQSRYDQLRSDLMAERISRQNLEQRLETQTAQSMAEKQELTAQLEDARSASRAAADNETTMVANRVAKQQELIVYFKGNSERVGMELRDLKAKNARVLEELESKGREVANLTASLKALKTLKG